ncbi:pentapeptide repeat-containing protein [Cyanobium gracile UHCC 0139]|uniref:Pentapeptide repeat-containing protein n=1 Tax=Cyanobium gracile UHCC 0139 TaxID=3110308 RepID=A0ABU5RSY6_9CYAN|nr:pentapeptide repeat-containing protein [Cyanobium gracile]MEA5390902.1 pentapeptide repeat-containing protein [Cyanobium gracile UHCC 0139]
MVIRFSGEKERSGWDWADLSLKVSVPILILVLSTSYSILSSSRQHTIATDQKESDVLAGFIKDMQPLILDKGLKESAKGAEVRGVAQALTLAALSQLKSPERKRLAVQFLLDSGLNSKPGNLFSLRGADLRETNLRGADLRGANLIEADLRGTNLRGANLREANLIGADLREADLSMANISEAMLLGADLRGAELRETNLNGSFLRLTNIRGANLSWANLSNTDLSTADLTGVVLEWVKWNNQTEWPDASRFKDAEKIPTALKKQIGLP